MKKTNPRLIVALILVILMLLIGISFIVMLAIMDALPKVALLGFVVAACVMIALASLLMLRKTKAIGIVGIVVSIALIVVFGMGTYYLATTYNMLSKISLEKTEASAAPKRVNVIDEAFNVYVTGIDQWTVEKGYDLERSDINMIVTVCPKTRTILLTSIPRDAYVALHRTGAMDKLTHTGIYGVDETLNTVHDWTKLDLNYYVKVNFTACVHIVDAIGGVDIDSPKAFHSTISKYSYKKGKNHLTGHQALYYARERKSFFEEQDQIRVKNQQIIIKAMLNKIMSSKTLLTRYGELMGVISEDMETNMPAEDLKALIKMQMTDLSSWNIKTQRMTGKYDMEKVASLSQKNEYTVLKIRKKKFKKCIRRIKRTMNPSNKEIAEATAERGKNTVKLFLKGGM